LRNIKATTTIINYKPLKPRRE